MKKFGTPIGAGPGSESEKLGFDAVGTPFPFELFWGLDFALPLDFAFGLGFGLGLGLGFGFLTAGFGDDRWCEEGTWVLAGPVG